MALQEGETFGWKTLSGPISVAVLGMNNVSISNKKRQQDGQGLQALSLGTKHSYLHHEKENSALASRPTTRKSRSTEASYARDYNVK